MSINEKLIFDIGLHRGEDTRYYLKQGYTVMAVEANPVLVEYCSNRFRKMIDNGRLTILNAGIAGKEGIMPFYKNVRVSEWSSFDKVVAGRNNTPIETFDVQCITTDMLFKEYGIPLYMKVDIEGHDHFCLDAIPVEGSKPVYVSCEAVKLYWLDILKAKGYTKFKLISQSNPFTEFNLAFEHKKWAPQYQTIKRKIIKKLQKIIPLKHEYGASGPFGEQSAGQWKSYEEVKAQFLSFFTPDGIAYKDTSWFDFHASL